MRGWLPSSLVRRFARGERGAAALEFAIIVPVLLTLVLGIVDIGRLLFVTSSLTAAVREGGRTAAVHADPDDPTAQAQVRARVTAAFQPMGGEPLGAMSVSVSAVDANGDITVAVPAYQYVPITPIARLIGLGTLTIHRQAVFRWERGS